MDAKPAPSLLRQEFYQRLRAKNAAPLWEVLSDLVTPAPRPRSLPTQGRGPPVRWDACRVRVVEEDQTGGRERRHRRHGLG